MVCVVAEVANIYYNCVLVSWDRPFCGLTRRLARRQRVVQSQRKAGFVTPATAAWARASAAEGQARYLTTSKLRSGREKPWWPYQLFQNPNCVAA